MASLKIIHGGGLTSCLTVILHEVSKWHKMTGEWPDSIDASQSFITCKDSPSQDLSTLLLRPSSKQKGPHIHFDHGQQYAHPKNLPIADLHELARSYAWPSQQVGDRAYNITKVRGNRTCVIYRGNDKATEIRPTPYAKMFDAAEQAGGPYMLLTDEKEFFNAFMEHFPDTISAPGSMQIPSNQSKVITGNSSFAVNFLATLYSFAGADKLVSTTGNTGLWPAIWRGTADGVVQVHP